MNYILFDDNSRIDLLPFTFTRPICEIRAGILTLREKWEKLLGISTSTYTERYLSEKFPLKIEKDNIFLNGSICPDPKLAAEIKKLKTGQKLVNGNTILAMRISGDHFKDEIDKNTVFFNTYTPDLKYHNNYLKIRYIYDIFKLNDELIKSDFELLSRKKNSAGLSSTNTILGDDIFVEEGAKAECAVFNTRSGPVYLGKNSEVMEGSVIRGPFALCEGSTLKMSAKIYGATTIGPHSKVGGEINNSVIFGYSNKAHDGFLGNSVIGEWCNIGADSNNSNLKNNYAEVKLWSYRTQSFVNTALTFCGLFMADHSKCGINTMFNTGTVVGVSANIFGAGFPRNYIPSFSWGGAAGFTTFSLRKAFEVAEKMMERRGKKMDDIEKGILTNIFELTGNFRKEVK